MTLPPLTGTRVLDLAADSSPLCGQILALLGADVVTTPRPMYPDGDSISELTWVAYNAGKSVLNGHSDPRLLRQRLASLAASADVLITDRETSLEVDDFSPAIHVKLTPFGAEGPRSDWAAGELISQAAGGLLYLSGTSAELPPAMLGIPFAACAAGAQAAVAVLLALRQRGKTGLASKLDLSAQEAVANVIFKAQSVASVGQALDRRGPAQAGKGIARGVLWPCQDGYFTWSLWTGPGMGRKNHPIIDWMIEAGYEPATKLRAVAWEDQSLSSIDPAQLGNWQQQFADFLGRFTKAELAEQAVRRRILLYPINDMHDVGHDPQLESREVFVPIELQPGRHAKLMGVPFRSTAYPVRLPSGAPLRDAGDVEERWRQKAGASGTTPTSGPLPLQGLRVLDFSWVVAGPVVTKYLAMFGADVVKVESRRRPDSLRMTGPYPLGKPAMDGSAAFANHNASKRSIGVDISHPAAPKLLRKFAQDADIVCENFSVGVLDRLGLGYDELRAVNPDVIMLRVSFQGQTGPRKEQAGFGNHVQAMSGLDSICGFPDGPPGGPNQVLPDFIGPWFGLAAVLAALEHRDRTGEGQCIDLAQYEAALMFLQPALTSYFASGKAPTRTGNRVPSASPHGVFPVAGEDQWIAIGVYADAQWKSLHALLPAAVREQFSGDMSLDERVVLEDRIETAMSSWTKPQAGEELAATLQAAGIAAYLVNDGLQLLSDPQLVSREHYVWPEHPLLGRVPVDSPSFRSTTFTPRITSGPPYASSTFDVLREWAELDSDSISDLLADGVISLDH